uniref:Uncharacterized protein n=1 Tax=Neobodo designis TaxID=312471 RepID=A0A7S1MNE8_NEODS|mmetsp:Transcript_43764/g.135162  ORF Transcript_43764/g.135162 Transcript_43764/m.135162 type:complete len:116 (+) Transcript_43764:758-1105(+)
MLAVSPHAARLQHARSRSQTSPHAAASAAAAILAAGSGATAANAGCSEKAAGEKAAGEEAGCEPIASNGTLAKATPTSSKLAHSCGHNLFVVPPVSIGECRFVATRTIATGELLV